MDAELGEFSERLALEPVETNGDASLQPEEVLFGLAGGNPETMMTLERMKATEVHKLVFLKVKELQRMERMKKEIEEETERNRRG